MDRQDEIEAPRSRPARRDFKVGQIWEPRCPHVFCGEPDYWRIEAITGHPQAPIIARAFRNVNVRSFGWDGICDGEEDAGDLDLVTMIEEAR